MNFFEALRMTGKARREFWGKGGAYWFAGKDSIYVSMTDKVNLLTSSDLCANDWLPYEGPFCEACKLENECHENSYGGRVFKLLLNNPAVHTCEKGK